MRRYGPLGSHVGQPQAAFKQHRIVTDQREHQPWNVRAGHYVPERILKLGQRAAGGNNLLRPGRRPERKERQRRQ
ncbi:hypothetical protein GCM10027345_31810 [Hymenobacter daeguensis]